MVEHLRRQRREERARRATAAAVAVAREHGVAVGEPAVLHDLFWLTVHLRPAPVVARVSTCMHRLRSPITDWLEREIAVTRFLGEQDAPVVPPSPELPAGPHVRDGFALGFWTYAPADPDRTAGAADCSAMLVDLHSVLRSYPGELPALGTTDMPTLLEVLDHGGGVLAEADVEKLRAAGDRLRPLWESPDGDPQPLHGDAHPGNIIATRDGLKWIDFEDVSLGPLERDLATMMDAEVVAHHRPDPERLARCMEWRALQVVLSLLAFYDDFGDIEGWDEGMRSLLGQISPVA